MTVKELIEFLKEIPQDAKVTYVELKIEHDVKKIKLHYKDIYRCRPLDKLILKRRNYED